MAMCGAAAASSCSKAGFGCEESREVTKAALVGNVLQRHSGLSQSWLPVQQRSLGDCSTEQHFGALLEQQVLEHVERSDSAWHSLCFATSSTQQPQHGSAADGNSIPTVASATSRVADLED